MRRKNFYMPSELERRAEVIAHAMGVDFSQLAREAILQMVEREEKAALEKELADACKKYTDFNKKFSGEWSHFETRID